MQNGCGRCELNHVDDIYKTQALNSGKSGWVIDNYSHMLYAKPEKRLLQWIIAIAQPLFRGWGPPLRGGIVIWLARALRALGARQHVIGLGTGRRFSIQRRSLSYQYRDSHYKDKMVLWPSYLYNGNTYTRRQSSYWSKAQNVCPRCCLLHALQL